VDVGSACDWEGLWGLAAEAEAARRKARERIEMRAFIGDPF
jgi:hypothetical protein